MVLVIVYATGLVVAAALIATLSYFCTKVSARMQTAAQTAIILGGVYAVLGACSQHDLAQYTLVGAGVTTILLGLSVHYSSGATVSKHVL